VLSCVFILEDGLTLRTLELTFIECVKHEAVNFGGDVFGSAIGTVLAFGHPLVHARFAVDVFAFSTLHGLTDDVAAHRAKKVLVEGSCDTPLGGN
jgi:hypothetical protein